VQLGALKRLRLDQALRRSIERNELHFVYQPQLDTASGRIAGAEALARWRHPEIGLVSPGQFIPIAEANGIIVDIGWLALHTACAQWQAWTSKGLTPGRLPSKSSCISC
jgi:EAL domain-containing protein (putative c-di-GMP-specific phosphodiesterase class I)